MKCGPCIKQYYRAVNTPTPFVKRRSRQEAVATRIAVCRRMQRSVVQLLGKSHPFASSTVTIDSIVVGGHYRVTRVFACHPSKPTTPIAELHMTLKHTGSNHKMVPHVTRAQAPPICSRDLDSRSMTHRWPFVFDLPVHGSADEFYFGRRRGDRYCRRTCKWKEKWRQRGGRQRLGVRRKAGGPTAASGSRDDPGEAPG